MQFNPRQQQEIAQKVNDQLEKMTMSWSNDLKEWHPLALRALDHVSIVQLRIPSNKYKDLFTTTAHGINMNIVAVLANNIEARNPQQMGMSAIEWKRKLALNDKIGASWEALCAPVRKKVLKEYEIMAGRQSMQIIKAEA